MEKEKVIIFSAGIIALAFTAYALAKDKPYIAASIMGSFSALGLIYSLMRG